MRLVLILAVSAFLLAAFAYLWVGAKSGSGSVRRINREDPRMVTAIKEAQAGLPDYLNQLQHPQPGQRFAFMGRFKTPNGNEYLWIKDPRLQGQKLSGTLDQPPMAAPMRKGDEVTVDKADVVDWYIRDADGSTKGKFTEQKQ